jgi:hypothetical protein
MRKLIIALFIVLIILLLGLGGYSFYRFVVEPVSAPFSDIVVFVMTLVGLLAALAAVGIWTGLRRILEEDVHKEVSATEEAARDEALSRTGRRIADSFWEFYKEKRNKSFLNEAIKMTEDALRYHEMTKLALAAIGKQATRGEKEQEDRKCHMYNNLAFGYAERGEMKDTAKAHFFGNYVKERVKDFPESEITYLETYAYVLFKLPKTSQDKVEALKIINELLTRPDVEEEDKVKWRQRYGLNL